MSDTILHMNILENKLTCERVLNDWYKFACYRVMNDW